MSKIRTKWREPSTKEGLGVLASAGVMATALPPDPSWPQLIALLVQLIIGVRAVIRRERGAGFDS